MLKHGEEISGRLTRLERGWGAFFERHRWTHWIGLTFRAVVSERHARESFRRWARSLARDIADEHVWLAWGTGPQASEAPHYHVLVELPKPVSGFALAIHAAWRQASALANPPDVREYDPERGARFYTAMHAEADMNLACPQTDRICKRRGCVFAPSPW